MPTPCDSGSTMTAAPTLRSAMRWAASLRVCPGPTESTTLLIPSRTCIDPPQHWRCRLQRMSQLATLALQRCRRGICHRGGLNSMPVQRPTTTRLRRSLFEEAVAIVEREFADDL